MFESSPWSNTILILQCIITRPVITLLQCGLDRHVDDNERYDPLKQRSFILDIHAVLWNSPLSKWYLSFFMNRRQNITNPSTNSTYDRALK